MSIWHTKVEIDGAAVVLALGAPSAEAAVGRVTTDHAAGQQQQYATADGHHVQIRWARAHTVDVLTVLSARSSGSPSV